MEIGPRLFSAHQVPNNFLTEDFLCSGSIVFSFGSTGHGYYRFP